MKSKRKILVQVGALIFVLFTLAALVNGFFIYHESRNTYIGFMEENAEALMLQVRMEMNKYASLPWLMDYWEANHAAMELPGDRESMRKEITRLLVDRGLWDARSVTAEQAEEFSEREQRLFAEYCYLEILPIFYDFKSNYDLERLFSVSVISENEAIPYFDSTKPGELTAYGNFFVLGERWPINVSLHPGLYEMIAERKDRPYFEQVTSTVNGVKYFFAYLPLEVGSSSLLRYICVAYEMTYIQNIIMQNLWDIEGINILIMAVSAVILLFLIFKSVIMNLELVQKTVRGYRETKDSGSVVKNLGQIRSQNEVGVLAADVSDMAVEMDRYIEDMLRMSAEREQLAADLALASHIQADVLPNAFPAFPDRTEFDIYASMDPAKEVGGDFYDFFFIDDTHLGMVIADVSDKGVPAALFMMSAKIIIQNYAVMGFSPAEVLRRSNEQIYSNNKEGMFVTVWIGILDTATGKVAAANAGHEYPAVQRAGGGFELMRDRHGLALGLRSGMSYEEYEIDLPPGSKLFVYTDGIMEASNAEDEMFEGERLLAALNLNPDAKPEKILQNVREGVSDFVKDADQFDDMTMLCIEILSLTE